MSHRLRRHFISRSLDGGRGAMTAAALAMALTLSACSGVTQTINHGYVISPEALEQIPEGSSREQVILALGSPSTSAMIGGEAFYYISQKEERIAFMKPDIVDQRVLAVYFDDEGRVKQIANYGMQDGKVFDFISRKTPTGGSDYGFVSQLLKGIGRRA